MSSYYTTLEFLHFLLKNGWEEELGTAKFELRVFENPDFAIPGCFFTFLCAMSVFFDVNT